jgi:hypothetical protein
MNTPRKKKRHSREAFDAKSFGSFSGTWTGLITDPEIALALAAVVSAFEHLEAQMSDVLAALFGTDESMTAGYVLRAIKSPRARRTVMRDLLEKAPRNVAADEFFDDVIDRYEDVANRRNQLVHGLWYSEVEGSGRTLLAKSNPHGLAVLDAQPIMVEA